MLVSSTMALLIFHLWNLSVSDRGVLKSPIIIVDSSLFFLTVVPVSISCILMLFLGAYMLILDVFLENLPFYHYVMPLFIHGNFPCSEVGPV